MVLKPGLDFAYPEAAKIGGLISGPPQRGEGTKESPSGWLIVLETWSPPDDVSSALADVSESNPADAPRNGRVDRQMVWGGCVGLVLKGRVRMEPLIAQVSSCFPSAFNAGSTVRGHGVHKNTAPGQKLPLAISTKVALSGLS